MVGRNLFCRTMMAGLFVLGVYGRAETVNDLPKVLIIGDSISMGYTPFAQEFLEGAAVVRHNPGNAQDTATGVEKLDEWLGKGDWDVIHFNWGLWDMRHDNGFDSPSRVPLAEYEKNLTTLVKRLDATGAKLIWAATTPVPEGADWRIKAGEIAYNNAARRIVSEHNIAINDLHSLVAPKPDAYQKKANVHFTRAGSQAMGRQVADCILGVLPWRRHVIDEASSGADGVRLADVNGDGLADIATGWEEGGITRVYINPGPDKAKVAWPAVTVGKTPAVEDAVFVDLDCDGAVDVVSCCEGKTQTVFVNWAPANKDKYLDAGEWKTEAIKDSVGKRQWMFCAPVQLDGKNAPDLVLGSKGAAGAIGWYEAPANPRNTGDYKWHDISRAGWIMSLVCVDMDGDGDMDVLTSDRKGDLRGVRWLENPGAGAKAWTNHFVGARDWEVMFLRPDDFDGDGLGDILLAAKQGADKQRIFFYYRKDKTGLSWTEKAIPFPPNSGNAKGVAAADIDGDGRRDVVFSCGGADGDKSGVMWIRNIGCDKWSGREIAGPAGIKFDRIELLDLDGDGDSDVLACEERGKNTKGKKGGLGVFWYENPYNTLQGSKFP
jgi:lysophospholipase L1-like esterase